MGLTDLICKNLKPKNRRYRESDEKGLYLQVETNGSKHWRMNYRFAGKQKTASFGSYPTISLKEAREKRDAAKKLLDEGIDPSAHKKALKQQNIKDSETTFEVVAREWHDHNVRNNDKWSDQNAKTLKGRMERDILPELGNHPIKTITRKQILNCAEKVKARGANDLAKRILNMCKHIYQFAVIQEYVEQNIVEDLKGMLQVKPGGHFAAIEAKDIPQFLSDLEDHRPNLKPLTYWAMQLMMLTFLRTNEMTGGLLHEFDFEVNQWLVPARRMKMKKDHIVPLSSQSQLIIHHICSVHNHPELLLPSRDNYRNHMSNNTLLQALDRMGYRGIMTGHGFRSLALSTIMERLGYRFEVPDTQLAHAKRGDVNKAYDRAKFLDERAVMMQDWADYLDKRRSKPIAAILQSYDKSR